MTAISTTEAQALIEAHDLIGLAVRADDARRARHGARTTFVRVFEVHVDAVPKGLPAELAAGEIRLIGRPASLDAACGAINDVRAIAGRVAVTGFSLADLRSLGAGASLSLGRIAESLRAAGLESLAGAAIDVEGAAEAIAELSSAGLAVPRITVDRPEASRRLEILDLVAALQARVGGVRAFAPLPRQIAAARPTTGYDDVTQVAVARLLLDAVDSIQVDWALYGPKLAQVALTMGVDDVDSVSPLPGTLGRRRSPIEEIRGNIAAAGQEPVERTGRFEVVA